MARLTRKAEREAWTRHIDGPAAPVAYNKFRVAPKEERGKYASKHEMDVATNLHALAASGAIFELEEQVRFELIPADPPYSAAVYVADFTYRDAQSILHVLDAKGMKTPVYQLKKKMLWHLKKIQIEEV